MFSRAFLDDAMRRSFVVQIARRVAGAAPEAGFVALVLRPDGVEAADRVAGVDHDGLVMLCSHRPDGIEARVVGLDERAVRVRGPLSQHLGDLHAKRAGLEAALHFSGEQSATSPVR